MVPAGKYRVRIAAKGFSPWKVEDINVHEGEAVTLTPVELGVEEIKSDVDAITVQEGLGSITRDVMVYFLDFKHPPVRALFDPGIATKEGADPTPQSKARHAQ